MKTVAVVFGSRSAEHDISIVTAFNAIIEPLSLLKKYDIVPIFIAKDGRWYSDKKLAKLEFFTAKDFAKRLAKLKPIGLEINHGLWLVKGQLKSQKKSIDVVFPATHGTYGEDGSLMGLLRMADAAFVGCDMQASAVAMDKGLTKVVTAAVGLKGPKYVLFDAVGYQDNAKKILAEIHGLKKPLFVKPTHLGSSIAITRVKNDTELINAIDLALHYDNGVIVEEAVQNLVEVTVPIIGNEKLTVAYVEEALNKQAEFFDFTTKYLQGGKGGKKGGIGGKSNYSQIPAKISKDLYKQSVEIAKAAYRAIGASGIARIDLLIDIKKKQVYLNEINPLPGSLYAHNWKKTGLSNVDLVEKLLELAQERHAKQKKLNTVFDTSFLGQF